MHLNRVSQNLDVTGHGTHSLQCIQHQQQSLTLMAPCTCLIVITRSKGGIVQILNTLQRILITQNDMFASLHQSPLAVKHNRHLATTVLCFLL